MRIQIDGAATINKGGELMLYSIIEQIEKKYPDADVFWNAKLGTKSSNYIDTNLHFHKRYIIEKFGQFLFKIRLEGILRKLKLPYLWLTPLYISNKFKVNIVFDARGYTFCDNLTKRNIKDFSSYYKKLKKNDSIIILLPQAFGPFNTNNGKQIVQILNNSIDLIIARENISKDFLTGSGFDPNKILVYPDFTGLCKGIFPNKYLGTRNKVCIIPNIRMIKDTDIKENDFIEYFAKVINFCIFCNKEVFLLNHESTEDQILCEKINEIFNNKLTIVCNLKAKEIKGVISQSYAVISARFHGVANALNSGVPCLATSWSHKYELLFNEFGQKNMLLNINEPFDNSIERINMVLATDNNIKIRADLVKASNVIKEKNEEMWERIWKFIENKNLKS